MQGVPEGEGIFMISWNRAGSYMMAIGLSTILNAISNTEPSLSAGFILLGLGLAFVVYDWKDL